MIPSIREQLAGLQAELKAIDRQLAVRHAERLPALLQGQWIVLAAKIRAQVAKQVPELTRALREAEQPLLDGQEGAA